MGDDSEMCLRTGLELAGTFSIIKNKNTQSILESPKLEVIIKLV